MFKDGVEVQPLALPGTKPLTSSTAVAPAGVIAMHSRKAAVVKADDFTSDEGETVTRKAAALQRDLQCIVTKTVSYNKVRRWRGCPSPLHSRAGEAHCAGWTECTHGCLGREQ